MGVNKTRSERDRRRFLPRFRHASAEESRQFLLLLVAIAAVHCLSFSTVPVTNTDDQIMLICAFNFTETGKLTAPNRFATKLVGGALFGKQAETGEVYAKYPPGYPLILALFLPLARLASVFFGPAGAETILCFPSVLAIAGTCWLLWRSALRLAFGKAAAYCSVAGFALGSFVWPYAGVNWSEPYQVFCLAAAFYSLLASKQEENHWRKYYLIGGCALGFGVLIKATLVILVPIFVLGALLSLRQRYRWRDALLRSAILAAPSILATIYLLAINHYLFGSVTDFGYRGGFSRGFSGGFFEGLYGLIVGVRKGLIYFFPLAILAPLGVWKLWKDSQIWALSILAAQPFAYVALISKWFMYEGGACWGPRLIMPIVPALVLLAGAALPSIRVRRVGWVLVAAGIAVNSLGALINYQALYGVARHTRSDYRELEPHLAQIPGHFWLLCVQFTTPLSASTEAENPLWQRPPWISKIPQAIPLRYTLPGQAILNPWPLRLLLPESRWKREEWWYMRALLEVAIMNYDRREMRPALALLDRGLSIAREDMRFLTAKGMVYYSMGDVTQALNYFYRALDADSEYTLAVYGKGMALESLGNLRAARAAYERVLQLPAGTIDPDEVRQRLARLTRGQ